MGGEDFSRYGLAGVPICMFRLGTVDQAAARRIQGKEASRRRRSTRRCTIPNAEASLRTSVPAMVAVVDDLLPPQRPTATPGE